MALHAFLIAILAALAFLLLLAGLSSILMPRRFYMLLMRCWISGDRWIRKSVISGVWRRYERPDHPHLGYAFIPRDVVLKNREDLYSYITSERAWRLRWRRPWMVASGLFLVLGAFFLFGVLITNPP